MEAKMCTKLSHFSALFRGKIPYKFFPPLNFCVVSFSYEKWTCTYFIIKNGL